MRIGIVGTGPAALMAGSQYLLRGFDVSFYDHKKAAGRKFLVAGHGGFNLSNNEKIESFIAKYSHDQIKKCVQKFDSQDLVKWLKIIGIETYEGSTGKIFPQKGIKPIEVLTAWLKWLSARGAQFHFESKLIDFNQNQICIQSKVEKVWLNFDGIVLALGGGSWSKTGSDGCWTDLFKAKNIELVPFDASNAGMNINFKVSPKEIAGEVLKNISVRHGNQCKLGEMTLTEYGLEGTAIYHLNAHFRSHADVPLKIDFKPQFDYEKVLEHLKTGKNPTVGLKSLKLSKAAIWLLKSALSKEDFLDLEKLAFQVKNFELQVDSLRPIDEAISTAGGVSWKALNEDFSLKNFPSVKVCGEMLDWDAPTGGYLLQACFASGFWVGNRAD